MKMYNRYGEHLPELAHLGIRKLLIASKLDDCFDTLMERGTPRKGEEASKLVTGVTNFEGFSTSVRLFERVKESSKVYPESRRSKEEETERCMTRNRICRALPEEYQVDCLLDFLVSWSLCGEISSLSSCLRGSTHMPEPPGTMH